MAIGESIKDDSRLVCLCIEAASQSGAAVESWRRQRRTLERMPSHLTGALLHGLLRRRLLYPSLLEVFKYTAEEVDLRGESTVDAEWLAYLGAFRYLRSLIVADCHRITNCALWAVTGMANLKEIDLARCSKVTDAGIRHLLSISTLEKINISETGVTAEGISFLSSLTNLSVLDLGGLPVTDLALSSLQVLTKLQYLDLWGSELSNEGAAILEVFPMLSFLNLAWTRVTELPNLCSLTCLNMSNCTIHSIFEGHSDKAPLTKLILSGASYVDSSEALLYVETSFLSYLDMSNSSLVRFCLLSRMNALEHLDLSSTSIEDNSVELIAGIGANLRILNLNSTKVTSDGVGILAGNVPKLQNIQLSGTQTDDGAISYIGMMPSLKFIDLSKTNVRGLIHQLGSEPGWIPSLTALQSLTCLEKLNLEETQVRNESLHPLSGLQNLTYLSLKSDFLTDMSLYLLSSLPKLINLSLRDAVLTNVGLHSFNPPATLKTLDLRGCWLLTADTLLLFCKKHPEIEVRHELLRIVQSDRDSSNPSSPAQVSFKSLQLKQKWGKMPVSPFRSNNNTFLDQRLKYSREELLALQFSSLLQVPPHARGNAMP
ncbi:Toll-like receptor 13 [Actinidia chinensis var. chinensis]|uniref:Toll-like receptor 13 n=1 Tax=Actinidia chinensis var. chinensis TaxID=1590841 RepID=A0A2R6Q8K7_ACTCC|nr:Toll-like receptor 13 [Actinidia chinensis var. chinensis]